MSPNRTGESPPGQSSTPGSALKLNPPSWNDRASGERPPALQSLLSRARRKTGESGRSATRAPVAEGFQRHPFRDHVAWVHSSAWVTFPQAPLSSRTVGFPESGWQQQLSPEDLPRHPEAQALARVRPWDAWLYLQLDTDRVLHRKPGSVSSRCLFAVSATYREPLRPPQALPATGWRPAPPRRALPPLHRSYWLMRPTKLLSLTSALAYTASPCRLPRAPAGGWWFPTLSPQSVRRCLDPYPVAARPVHLPASSRVASASR